MYLADIKTDRWQNIDILRFVASVLVVYFHTAFTGNIGYAITAISRVAVPLFFMISGFFLMSFSSKETRKIKSTFKMILIGFVIYFSLWMFAQVVAGRDIVATLGQQLAYKRCINMLFWNQPVFGEHLWFLLAYLCILLIAPVLRYGKVKVFGVLLIIGNLFLGNYAPIFLGKSFPVFLSRNWLFTGIPFVCLGMLCFEKKDELIQNKYKKLLWIGAILAGVCSILEAAWLREGYGEPTGDVYISTFFFAGLVFVCTLNCKCTDNNVFKVFEKIGRNYTLWIYLIHPLFSTLLDQTQEIALGLRFVYTKCVIVYLVSLVAAMVIKKCQK